MCTPVWRRYAELQPTPKGKCPTHDWLWPRFADFLQPNDLLVVETGTSQVGINETRLPKALKSFIQEILGSLGFAADVFAGAFLAEREQVGGRRKVLMTGEGSLQVTIYKPSPISCYKPIVFISYSGCYSVELLIYGSHEPSNAVPRWKYGELLDWFGVGYRTKSYQVCTCQ